MDKQTKAEIRKELADYPAGYNAHKDSFADEWEHAEAVNKLLALLRKAIGGDHD